MLVLLLMTMFVFLPPVLSGPSQRGRCSLECYSRCMQSGTPSAVYCNCPVDKTQRPCSTVEAKLRNADVAPQVPEMSSEYIDSHTIKVRIAEVPNAFAYIFEYSTISTQPDEWYFAGASTTSSLKFTILDPCRDYQFRVIVVIRSSDPDQLFLVFRPRAIPVNLPPFVLGSQQMTVDVATASADTSSNTIKLYVKWTLPKGYIDADVYGYESPSLYPIQCSTPEGELPQPKIEIVKGGGRLAVSLPMSVLEDRCRMWVEVKMLPKCVRLEPFIIQKNVEIDCDKSADLEVCSRGGKPSAERATNKPRRRSERNPACTEVVDIFGNKGKVKIMWEQPGDTTPLYYHVRYGPAEIKGVSPFLSWQLSTKRDVKVDSNVLSLTLHIPENQQFGVQVCAIYSERRKRPKFGVVHVIPFECLGCPVGVEKTDGPLQCGECGRLPLDQSLAKKARKPVSPDLAPHTPVSPVFDTTSSDPWKTAATTEQADSGDKEFGSVKSKSQNPSVSEQTVFRMETDLVVAGKDPTNTRPQNIASGNTHHSPMSPISIEKAERIIEGGTESSSQESQERRSQSSLRYTPKPSAKPKTRVITTTLSENKEDKEDWVEYVEDTTLRTTTEEITASTVPFELSPEAAELMKELSNLPDIGQIGGKDMNTTTSTGSNARVVDVDAEMGLIETNTKSRIGESRKKGKMSMKNDDKDLIIGKANERIELTKELEESVRNLEKALAAEGRTLRVDLEDEFKTLPITEPMNEATTTTESTTRRKIDLTDEVKRIIEDAEEDLNDKLSSVATTSADLRLHEKSKKCMLYNGAICEFGCETRKSCYCPLDTHVKMENGLCMSRDLVSQTTCLPKRDINATWDPVLHNVMIYSKEASDHIAKVMRDADRLWIEFGRVVPANVALHTSNLTLGGYVFADEKRNRMIQSTQKIYENDMFAREPFVFHVNSSISPDDQYGIRLCTYRSEQVENPFTHNWDSESKGMKDKTDNVAQLSPVHFTHGFNTSTAGQGSFWSFFFLIGKVIILLILLLIMTILIYLNCSRIKSFYDRKRTHYFKPFYIDPQIHVTEITSRCPSSERDNSIGYYDTKNYETRSRVV